MEPKILPVFVTDRSQSVTELDFSLTDCDRSVKIPGSNFFDRFSIKKNLFSVKILWTSTKFQMQSKFSKSVKKSVKICDRIFSVKIQLSFCSIY